ncbi:acetyl-CoA synthetase-like protein [Trametes versicolor FP-101664 SS1]|uniref:acetyl-CoA synthetase-like protein n=1 Tax=Trametes versicolor (strain FP-101664) TaxID=717944 RepID=UPI0004621517|nr:acetyl-CoA synthetase-like protein [Trametes versicolor FP-101664 SS1]EIW54137.1 acetyl-CoA synthetase-like protein [Trametes versicolor FP-101664 SS1]
MASQPTPQGVDHPTFDPPPYNHGLSVPGLYEYQAKNSPDHPVFKYAHPSDEAAHHVTFSEAWDKIGAVVEVVLRRVSKPCEKASDAKRLIVGILAISDTLSYIYTLVAIMSLGYTAFPIAHSLSADAVAHLLEAKGVMQLWVSGDEKVQALAHCTMDMLGKKGIALTVLPMVTPQEYAQRGKTSTSWAREVVRIADDEVTVIYHSSGSTGLPKPIPITGRALANACNTPCFGDLDLAGKCIAAHTNPPCHGTGIMTMTWPASISNHEQVYLKLIYNKQLASGLICALYPPVSPLIVPTPANFLVAWRACKCDIVVCMPVFIEALVRNPANLPALKALDMLVYTGATLTKSVGDKLVQDGVRLLSSWGSTEVGAASKTFPCEIPGEDWEYFEFSPSIPFVMRPHEGAERVFEPIRPATETSYPNVTNMELDGRPAWATGDLLEQHPKKPTHWKVLGRKDEKIIFSTGQCLNPVPIENILAQDLNIGTAIVFGHGRIRLGLLVEPTQGERGSDDGSEQWVENYKDLIWPTVEEANKHIRGPYAITRRMILVASAEKPLEHTQKSTTRRGLCLKLYKTEIDDLYAVPESDESPVHREFPGRM